MAELLSRIATEQDRTAFAEVFAFYAPRVKAYLIRGGASAAAAEELMQEAMVSVWRRAGSFDPAKAAASTWIFTIARNLRIDAFRRDQRSSREPDEADLAPAASQPADELLAREQEAAIARTVLAQLPLDQQTVIRMTYYEDKSNAEIAAELNLPLGTVKSRIRLALERLRTALAGAL